MYGLAPRQRPDMVQMDTTIISCCAAISEFFFSEYLIRENGVM